MILLNIILFALVSTNAGASRLWRSGHHVVKRLGGPDCGESIAVALEEEVDIHTPSPRAECVRHVTAPAGAQIVLDISRVALVPADQLLIYDHPSSTDPQYLVASYQGKVKFRIGELISSRGGVTIHYLPRPNGGNIEIYAIAYQVDDEPLGNAAQTACGGKVFLREADTSATLLTPYSRAAGYRSRRPFGGISKNGAVSCIWPIEAPAGHKIKVTWNKVQTVGVSVGIYDHVTMLPDQEVTRLEGTFDFDIAPFVSSGNTVLVYVKQDEPLRTIGDGFQATVTVVDEAEPLPTSSCGGAISVTETPTRITSPNYDLGETADCRVQCWWYLAAPANDRIRLNIVNIDTSANEHVAITEETGEATGPGVFTGQMANLDPVYSQSNRVRIHLEDDITIGPQGLGFDLNAVIAESGHAHCWGDPHYGTFDGLRYDFQGDCEYTLLTPCQPLPDGTPDFNLWGNNVKSTFRSTVSVLREVTLEYNGTTYFIGQGRELRVDGVILSPPVRKNGVSVSYVHPLLVVKTEFGLRYSYDGSHFLQIWISARHRGNTCGLLGTFDGDRTNDYTLRNGSVTTDVNLFGYDWSIDKDTCEQTDGPEENPCNNDAGLNRQVTEICSIFDPNHLRGAVFAGCFELVDHQQYYDSCLYDLCFTHPQNQVICASVEDFVLTCQGVDPEARIGNWRDLLDQCTFECSSDKEYQACGTTCPNTCTDRTANDTCGTSCRETCACPEGQVLDGENCVLPENCGCSLPNGLYVTGGTTWTSDMCDQRCACEGGVLECEEFGCGENEECSVQRGVRDCFCQRRFTLDREGRCMPSPGTCSISGDPHYYTFDGQVHHFQGDCKYTLIKPCDATAGDGVPDFHIWGDNEKTSPASTVSYLRVVYIAVNGTTYTLGQGKAFQVNGVATPNANYNNGDVHVWTDFNYITLETTFGVRVQFNGGSSGRFQVPPLYWNNTCGLCGTFDYDNTNEFTTSYGNVTTSTNEFGESWEVGSDECTGTTGPTNTCENSEVDLAAARAVCNGLVNPDGPFRFCSDFISGLTYRESCVYDACVLSPIDEIVCSSYEQYAAECQGIGQTVGDWRAGLDQCVFTCPEPQIYQACGSACPATCANLTANENCNTLCRETCTCPEGLLLDGERCVPLGECGCNVDGVYYSNGQEWLTEDCSQACSCAAGEAVCFPNACHALEECSLNALGVRGCYCQNNFTRTDDVCVGDIASPVTVFSVLCTRRSVILFVNGVAYTETIGPFSFPDGAEEVCVVFRTVGNAFYLDSQNVPCRELVAQDDWNLVDDGATASVIDQSSFVDDPIVVRTQSICQYRIEDFVIRIALTENLA